MARAWYVFMGGDDPLLSSRYIKIRSKPTCLCGDIICAIYAPDNGLRLAAPLSEHLCDYIKKALSTGMIQPEYPFGSKKYVYLRQQT